MPLTGIDESVKQAILQRNTFENIELVSSVSTLRSRRSSYVTGVHSPGSRRQSRVQFSDLPAKDTQTLDLPSTSNGKPGGGSPV